MCTIKQILVHVLNISTHQIVSCNIYLNITLQRQIRQICNYVRMECRGNQRFDADQPHPVCDYPGQRTQGYERKLLCSPNMSSDVTLLYLMFK